MDVKICSYNVRGLGNKQKRDHIFKWLKEQGFFFCLLQETHADKNTAEIWNKRMGQ